MEDNTNITENGNAAESSGEQTTRMELTSQQFEKLLKHERASGRGQGILISVAAAICITILLLGGCALINPFGSSDFSKPSSSDNQTNDFVNEDVSEKAAKLWDMIETNYLWDEDIDKDYAIECMYKGMLASLGDPYSTYYTKDEYSDLLESFQGEYSGIGAYVSQNATTGETYISKPMPGSPAEEAGLLPDDRIIEVDGEVVEGLDLNVVVSKIKGPEGTTVDLGILREGNPDIMTITVTRRTIEVIRVEGKMLDNDIGYILISEIEDSTYDQFNKIYDDLISQGMKGLVLDLRDNPGGDLNVVIKLADIFLDDGIIVYTKDKYDHIKEYTADRSCKEIPMVILVNSNTASAAEILSGSLKEGNVATIIGTNTFGKGIVQSILPLYDGSGIKITESEYFLRNDTKIHKIGVIPDIMIEFDKDAYINDGTDNQLDKAIQVMEEKLK